jgi:hypothetical protein
VDASGHLQTMFPVSGDLSDAIVSEIIKAAAAKNRPASNNLPSDTLAIPIMANTASRADN